MTTLSLEASKKVYELCGMKELRGRYGTQMVWNVYAEKEPECVSVHRGGSSEFYPAFNFAELIRLLPKIWEKKGWSKENDNDACLEIAHLALIYADKPTEPEGMAAVESYLISIL